MRPVLFAKADPSETFGVGPVAIADAGADVRVWDAIGDEPPPVLKDVAGVVLFGSQYNVEHADERPFIHSLRKLTTDAVEQDIPFLGICFGAQVLAWSLGAEIRKAPAREIGYVAIHPTAAAADDPLLGHYSDGDPGFQWHMDTFDLPVGAELLATGDTVTNQAFRLTDRPDGATWATQFHLEIDVPEMDLWIDEVAGTVEAEWGMTPEELRRAAAAQHERHEDLGREVFRRFVKVCRERS
jgi:GMP synthase (glutamine-hydrolysing)